MTGRIVECPIDEMNRPRGRQQAKLRIPPTAAQVGRLFAGWREELATCRKFAPAARNYTACRLLSEVGLRVNEACKPGLPDIKWELGRFGKLHVRHGKGARGSGPRERMVPLINNAGQTLRWFVEDVWGQFGDDHTKQARCSAAAVRTQECRRHRFPDRRRDTPLGAGKGRRDAPAGLARRGHSARPSPFLRQPALPGRHGPDRDPGHLGARLYRHDHAVRARPRNPYRGQLDRRSAACRRSLEGIAEMIGAPR